MIILSMSDVIYVCTNELGMYKVVMSILYFALITPIVMIASNAAVISVASLRKIYTR